MFRRLKDCHNVEDLRLLAKQRLPGPIFHYIDGAADDEITYRRNTSAFDDTDLVPNVLAGAEKNRHVDDRDGPEIRYAALLFPYGTAATISSRR